MFYGKQIGQELCFWKQFLIAYFLVGGESEREVAFDSIVFSTSLTIFLWLEKFPKIIFFNSDFHLSFLLKDQTSHCHRFILLSDFRFGNLARWDGEAFHEYFRPISNTLLRYDDDNYDIYEEDSDTHANAQCGNLTGGLNFQKTVNLNVHVSSCSLPFHISYNCLAKKELFL